MERPVRSAWAQDAIVEPRLVPSSVLTPDFRRGTGPFFRSELSRQERNFRLQRRLVKIGCGDAITIRRDGISRTTTSNVPARTPFFRWGVVSAVWKDCMVETEGTKLPAPLAVISNQSLTTVPGTESWCGKTGRDSSARPAVERRPWWDPARLASKSSRFIIAEAVSSRQFTQAR
jgi:hypothetical protein